MYHKDCETFFISLASEISEKFGIVFSTNKMEAYTSTLGLHTYLVTYLHTDLGRASKKLDMSAIRLKKGPTLVLSKNQELRIFFFYDIFRDKRRPFFRSAIKIEITDKMSTEY